AQGEDVVAGIRTPQSLTIKGKEKDGSALPAMEETMPSVFRQLDAVRETLEAHYRDMQDIEFTVQQGTLYMLQTRTGKRTTAAALKIAVDMVAEGLVTKEEALLRIDPQGLDQLLHPTLDPQADKTILAKGLAASPGAASGAIVFSADEAEAQAADGKKVVLCRQETSPEDIHGMHAAQGILTTRGGMTSHAAVVARGMGTPCVAGAGTIRIDYAAQTMVVGDVVLKAGETITIDGATGEVMKGAVPTIQPELSGDFGTVMGWADAIRRMKIRANAETPADAQVALDFGAEGIGLCRTEHMFFDPDRIQNVREMIVATSAQYRRAALEKLLPAQRDDFTQLFKIMAGRPVTIRLLDPPLHEFLPQTDKDIAAFSQASGIEERRVRERLSALHEMNPMLGHRGCRLGISFPEIYEMQVRAILEAALAAGAGTAPEIMIPLIATAAEFSLMKELVDETAEEVFAQAGGERCAYMVGTMIELPRAALTADDVSGAGAEFFSFGTNDLTQTALGLSRDDAGQFLPAYVERGVFARDPFVTIDRDGVGQLVNIAVEKGRAARPDLKLGICGEHGGDPASIGFFEESGLDYVSCSPYRVPIARLAAAQATIQSGK
ncbi:MAG: pyruvate, phosphate dikinase, partial [Alphaproteobacteria bacterium]|nr:pyruvate, phosphate dikinase [Alphaproteobacteria bacterium]